MNTNTEGKIKIVSLIIILGVVVSVPFLMAKFPLGGPDVDDTTIFDEIKEHEIPVVDAKNGETATAEQQEEEAKTSVKKQSSTANSSSTNTQATVQEEQVPGGNNPPSNNDKG